jgi:uncharacterized protein YjbI with pentapeptide repeats
MAITASKKELTARWKTEEGERLYQAALLALHNRERESLASICMQLPHAADVEGFIDLRGIVFSGEIYGADLSAIDFSYASVPKGSQDPFLLFKRCTLTGARLREIRSQLMVEVCSARGADFTASNLRKNGFRGCELQGARFDDANLRSANFYKVGLEDCSFTGANLANAMLDLANCSGTDFTGANLDSASLEDIVVSPTTRLPIALSKNDAAQPLSDTEIHRISRNIVEAALTGIEDDPDGREFEPWLRDVLNQFRNGGYPDVFASIDETFQEPQRTHLLDFLSRAAREM